MGSCKPPGIVVCRELTILLVGPKRTGKSSSGNTLLGWGQAFETRGGGVSRVVSSIAAGLHMRVVDAQGWGPSEESVPAGEKAELMRAVSLCGLGGPHVVLLVIPLLDFTEPEWSSVERRMELLTSTVWRHTMVLFTCGDRLRGSVEEYIQSGGPALQQMVEKCRYRYHVFNNKASDQGKQERRRQEVKSAERKRAGGLWRKAVKEAGMKSKGVTAEGRQEGDPEQVRELLGKVENMLQENGGWHFSLHMYRRLEDEWSCREQELRARLEAHVGRKEPKMESLQEQRVATEEQGENLKEEDMEKMNRGAYEEEGVKKDVKTPSKKEDASDGRGEMEESPDFKTRITAPCCPDGGQRLASCPIRGLA